MGSRPAKSRKRARELVGRAGLADRLRDRIRTLSGGQVRRVEIARALLHGPRLVLLDEPTAGLDIKARADILALTRRLVDEDGIGVLWTTHLVDEVRPEDQVVVLHKGRVLASDTARAIMAAAGTNSIGAAFARLTGDAGEEELVSALAQSARRPFGLAAYWFCFLGIVWRESLRFLHQRGRFVSALVRPLVWLFIFAAGFRQTLGISIIPPYETYVLYEVYITPGLIAMIQLFNGMQSSLSMVYDREMGSMRMLLVSPAPRWFLLTSKLVAGVAVSILQVYAYLVIAWFWEIEPPSWWGYLTILPALVLSGLMLGALGMVLSSLIKQLENFAGVMNFVIFPMFFASSALYPLWRVQEGSPWLATVCGLNPFTYAVELIRFAFWGKFDPLSFAVVLGCTIVFLAAAVVAYDPERGMLMRRGG